MNGPKLIDIGRGTIDARYIIAVHELYEDDSLYVGSQPTNYPAYAKTEIITAGFILFSPLPAAEIIGRWRTVLGLAVE